MRYTIIFMDSRQRETLGLDVDPSIMLSVRMRYIVWMILQAFCLDDYYDNDALVVVVCETRLFSR